MIALFCGTASLPHILIRYYTVKDQASAEEHGRLGIASIGFFYIDAVPCLGAMTSGTLNVAIRTWPLAARAFIRRVPFAVISAICLHHRAGNGERSDYGSERGGGART